MDKKLRELKKTGNQLLAGLSQSNLQAGEKLVSRSKNQISTLLQDFIQQGSALDVECSQKLLARLLKLLHLYLRSAQSCHYHESDMDTLTLMGSLAPRLAVSSTAYMDLMSKLDQVERWLQAEAEYTFDRFRPRLDPQRGIALAAAEESPTFYLTDFEYSWDSKRCLDRIQSDGENNAECMVTVNATGVDSEGNSLYVRMTGFLPRLYVRVPENFPEKEAWADALCSELQDELVATLLESKRHDQWGFAINDIAYPIVGRSFLENGAQICPYNGPEPESFLMIFVRHPQLVAKCRDLLQYPEGRFGERFKDTHLPDLRPWCPARLLPQSTRFPRKRAFDVFQANIDFTTVFLTENSLRPSSWFTVNPGAYQTAARTNRKKRSRRQYELVFDYRSLAPLPKMDHVKPALIYGCMDIEVMTTEHKFPRWENPEQVVTHICIILWRDDARSTECRRYLFCWKFCEADQVNAEHVYWYKSEAKLLDGFDRFCQTQDIDMIVGHNSDSFDYPYLKARAERLGLAKWGRFGAVGNERIRLRAGNNRGINFINVTLSGQLYMDTLKYVKRRKTYPSNTLNYVSEKLFGENKDEIAIGAWAQHMQTLHGRNKAARYNVRDVDLTMRIFQRLQVCAEYEFLARMTFTPMQLCVNRGVSFPLTSNLLNRCIVQEHPDLRYLVPTPNRSRTMSDEEYQAYEELRKKVSGAIVLNPQRGFHSSLNHGDDASDSDDGSDSVMLLDFKSLYPSIIMGLNLCFTTAVDNETIARLGLVEGKDYHRIPDFYFDDENYRIYKVHNHSNPAFVLPHVRKGILPATEELYGQQRSHKKRTRDAHYQHEKRLRQFMRKQPITEPDCLCRKAVSEARNDLERTLLGIQEKLDQQWRQREAVGVEQLKAWAQEAKYLGDLDNFFQGQIKVLMNSFYGYTGQSERQIKQVDFSTGAAFVDKTGGLDLISSIAQTITTVGRFMLMVAKYYCEMNFNRAKGKTYDTKVIYGDTDSVMVLITGQVRKNELKGIADEICAGVNQILEKPAELEAEAHFEVFGLEGKKNYIGWKVNYDAGTDDEPLVKGLSFKKRGVPPFVRKTCNRIVDAICRGGSVEKAAEMYSEALDYLYSDQINYGDFIYKKGLRATVDSYTNQNAPHVVMAKRLNEKYGMSLGGGDKVDYVLCEKENMSKKTSRKKSEYIEEPTVAAAKRAPIAREHYKTALENNVFKVLALMTGDTKKAYTTNTISAMFAQTSASQKRLVPDDECQRFVNIARELPQKLEEFPPEIQARIRKMTPNAEGGGKVDHLIKKPNGFKQTKKLVYGGKKIRVADRKRKSNCRLMENFGFKLQKKPQVDLRQTYQALTDLQCALAKCIRCKGDGEEDVFTCQATDCANYWERDQHLFNYKKCRGEV